MTHLNSVMAKFNHISSHSPKITRDKIREMSYDLEILTSCVNNFGCGYAGDKDQMRVYAEMHTQMLCNILKKYQIMRNWSNW